MLEYVSTRWSLVISATVLVVALFGGSMYVPEISANGITQTICVLQPIDQSIPPHVVNMTMKVLSQHNETARYIGLIQELTDKSNAGCGFVIQFQRAVNSNYYWVDKNAHYTISGNTLTLYTDKTPVNVPDNTASGKMSLGVTPSISSLAPISPSPSTLAAGTKSHGGGDVGPPMTNWSCLGEALATYHQNIGWTGSTPCNPYAGRAQSTDDNIPFYIIHKSLEQALVSMHL